MLIVLAYAIRTTSGTPGYAGDRFGRDVAQLQRHAL